MPKQLDGSVVLRILGVEDRTRRACYLCDEILGQPGVFRSESLFHMLMECPHASMLNLRVRLRDDVKEQCLDAHSEYPEPPKFPNTYFGDSELWSVLMLCTTAASFPPDPAILMDYQDTAWVPFSEEATKVAEEIRAKPTLHIRDGIVHASRWTYAVMQAWKSKLRDNHVPDEASAMTGAKLAAIVCKHMRTLFRTRRRLLENNVEYSVRSRNPPPNKNGGLVVGSPGTGGADGGDASLRAPSVLSPPPPLGGTMFLKDNTHRSLARLPSLAWFHCC